MCMLNIAGMYRPRPDDVANNSTRQPSSHATIRPVGHWSPRRRSRRTPTRYASAITIAAVPKIRSNRQSNKIRATVGGPAKSYPISMAGIDGLKIGGGGGGVRLSATATPNVRPKTTASVIANLISGPRASGSDCSAATPLRR